MKYEQALYCVKGLIPLIEIDEYRGKPKMNTYLVDITRKETTNRYGTDIHIYGYVDYNCEDDDRQSVFTDLYNLFQDPEEAIQFLINGWDWEKDDPLLKEYIGIIRKGHI